MRAKIKVDKSNVVTKEVTDETLKRILFRSMLKMQELAKINVRTDTGDLRRSIKLDPILPNSDEYVLFSNLDYATDIEYGTKPHIVPIEDLKPWARRKLGDEDLAFAVAKKIKEKGTDAHPYFRPALDQVKNIELKKIAKQEFRK